MKIELFGCGNKAKKPHHPVFRPKLVQSMGFADHYLGAPGAPMEWASGIVSWGQIEGLSLDGNYSVSFTFEAAELKNWLKSYIAAKPEEALDLIAEVLPLAVEACKKRGIRG